MGSEKRILIERLQKDWKKYWDLDFFKENNFLRKKCKNCGKFFWTLDPDTELCGDSSCVPYSFLGNPPTKKKLDYIETWKTIEKFFVKNGHQSIKRYPTICRWYPLFFTVAGIVDFYRIANNKITFEFPANPVILSQPCLRFNDIPNVGITGRHNTCFDMIQQSSLWDGKNGYWKDKCIELDFRLLTEAFGIKKEDITFIEDAWIGYGAFGYSLEYFVKGLETGNAVFTEFEGDLNKFSTLKEKVIDMGAGQQRLCWLTQGTPTNYDVMYGPVMEKMKTKSGIKYDEKFFLEYSKYSGVLNMDEVVDMKAEMAKVAKILGVSTENLMEKIQPLVALYSIADHSKALLYALSDGGLPSNVGGGYNLRVIFRRALNFLEKLNYPFDIEWVIEEHAKYLKKIEPELMENLGHVNQILDIEKKKYKETKSKMKSTLESLIENKTELNDEKLIELYDSQGITPEILQETADKYDVKVKIPADFYAKVTEKHLQEKRGKEEEKVDVSGTPKTKKLYYDNEKLYEFKAKVLKVECENIVLDQTLFYPRGGGQEPDHGSINDCEVYDVEPYDNVIFHRVKNPNFKVGDIVVGKIDSKRREQIVKHHTATHLVNMSARILLGNHVWQAGSKKDVDKAHLDITHYENLTEEQTRKIEKFINNMIKKKVKVKKEVLKRSVAEQKYGFVIYQGGSIPETTLRIISIHGIDSEACAGLHVDNTEEIEEVFIFNTKKMQDGVIRIEYVAGKELVRETRERIKTEKKLEEEHLEKKQREIEEQKGKIKKLKEKSKSLFGVNYVDTEDMKEIETIAQESVKEDSTKCSIIIGNGVVFGIRGKDCKEDVLNTVKEIAKVMGGSAGGSGNEFKGGGPLKNKGREAFEKFKSQKL
ncbi:alanine--tRNA ligase [Candidatus Micrarchaeota archaeon RBG_16_36_9]|nr:MAG: alanine--tRNA ligase [Candidatus Micrarchaeota archaeon RBG_16_36_9]